ncbi:hypothetical protein [Streptomyces sp. NPDC006274]|uniref:hypothetical protein n=1 Tax=unclassified Streptomyces TaxID=2593676 RepID=UPI0033AC7626
MAKTLDGLVLSPVADQAPGRLGTRPRSTYHVERGVLWAEGGGRVRLEETWEWASQEGRGTSVVEELPSGPPAAS